MNTTPISADTSLTVAVSLLEKSDRAILRQIANAAQFLEQARKELAAAGGNVGTIAYRAQRVAERAATLETLYEVALTTGCAVRNENALVAALDGNDDDLY